MSTSAPRTRPGASNPTYRHVALAALSAGLALSLATAGAAAQTVSRPTSAEVQVGDRILVLMAVAGDTARSDTLTVREGKTILLPVLPDIPISLQGVRRSELSGVLARELAKYVHDARVEAKVLLRLQVSGAVAQPGFYQVETDRLLSDVIMLAGGPAGTADLNRTVIKRQGERLVSAENVRRHMVAGTTIDQLDLRPGDEIEVAAQRQRNLLTIVQVAAALAGTALSIYFLATRL